MNFDLDSRQLALLKSIQALERSWAVAAGSLPDAIGPEMERLGETGLFSLPPSGGAVGWQCGLEELARAEPRLAWAAGTGVTTAAALLAALDAEPIKSRLLSRLCQGGLLLPVAFSEPGASSRPERLACLLEETPSGLIISGEKNPVAYFPQADSILVAAQARDRVSLCLVESGRAGVSFQAGGAIPGLEPLQLASLTLDGVLLGKDEVSGPFEMETVLRVLREHQRKFSCAFCVGLARRALEAAISFCTEKRREGKPPAGHQLVRFGLAEMRARLDAAEILCRRAAWAADAGSAEAGQLSRCARIFAAESACQLSDQALRLSGNRALLEQRPLVHLLLAARSAAALGEPVLAERMQVADGVLSALG